VLAQTEQPAAPDQRSRAYAVADAVAASQRREAATPPPPPAQIGQRTAGLQAVSRDIPAAAAVPLGQSYRRRTRGRVSASAGRRDRNA